ncbi:MAG TPA: ABC transporter substrate-binding protein [Casimicrobiaceae bacterium]|nr:ABC transporter substrate-binding protein [Casimicrobiaceae bacterium]
MTCNVLTGTQRTAGGALRFAASLLAAAALGVSAIAYAAVDDAARALLPDDLKQKGTLTVAMPLDFEPFNYLDEKNEQTGLDVDMIRAIGERLGLKVDIQRMGFASMIPSVSGGRVDAAMSAMGILPARLPLVSFVRYGHFSNGLVVRKGNPTNIRNDDACGHTISVEKGTQPLLVWQKKSDECVAAGKPKIELLVFDGKGPQVLAVESGRAEAAGVGFATAIVAAKHSNGKLDAAPGGPVPGATVECGIAFSKTNVKLGQAMEAALKAMQKDGTYDKIYDKWQLSAERAPAAVIAQQ